jgi:aspartyl/asparaginyl beta-hydroxylase (cupin superfamily)
MYEYEFRKTFPTCEYNEENADYKENFLNNDTVYKNLNHLIGKKLFKIFILANVLILIYFNMKNKNILYISLILYLYFILNILKTPIHMMYIISYLLAKNIKTPPYLSKEKYFPNYVKFENNFIKIKEELNGVLNNKDLMKSLSIRTGDTYDNCDIGIDNGWRIIPIKATFIYKQNIRKYFPLICKILDETPEVISCAISMLGPNKQIPIHVGYYKGFIRYQLAIEVPKDKNNAPFICVNKIRHEWKEGHGFVFDDTFPHKVYNPSSERRIVFYMDIMRDCEDVFLNKLNNFFIYKISSLNFMKKQIKKEINKTEIQV